MGEQPEPRIPVWKLLLAVVAMAVVVVVVGETLRRTFSTSYPEAHHGLVDRLAEHDLAVAPVSELGRQLRTAVSPAQALRPGMAARSLDVYYQRRAYPGAPPIIPHDVDPEIARTMSCNTCHERGGFSPKHGAYTPVTPHPQYENCMQCHVPATVQDRFRETDWKSISPPAIRRPALPGSPPPVPHTLQLRENCLACHAGPSAVAEVRTSHPERLNCRQCHVPRSVPGTFIRTAAADDRE